MFRFFLLLFLFARVCPGQELIRQTISPEEELWPGRTTLWCPAFQNCWDHLREMHGVDAIELSPANSRAKYLNQFDWDADKSLPPRGVISIVGADGPTFVKTVNSAIHQHFGRTVEPLNQEDWPEPIEGGMAVLTILKRAVGFGGTFEERTDASFPFFDLRGGVQEVKAFGSWTAKQRSENAGSARVLTYVENTKLALALKTEDPEEYVVLLHDPEQQSLMAAIRETKKLLDSVSSGAETYTTNQDTILIPRLNLSSLGRFENRLEGTYTTPETPPGFFCRIVKAMQNIHFSLDQAGADMEVRTFLVGATFLSSDSSPSGSENGKKHAPRHFVFNKPFFLMLWRKGGTIPYLACYVDTAGLVPWQQN